MYQGRRIAAQPSSGYQPKRLAKPGKYLLKEGPRHTGIGIAARGAAAALGVLALAGAVKFSAAYLHDQGSVDNAFVMGSVAPSVVETFYPDTGVKEDVRVKNDGNAPVYIRALLLVTWQDTTGATLSEKPQEGMDYTRTGPAADSGWKQGGDGYWYYTKRVQPGDSTTQLVQKLTDQNDTPGRRLCVDVIAQSVQASPGEAVSDLWGASVTVDAATGVLTLKEEAAAP